MARQQHIQAVLPPPHPSIPGSVALTLDKKRTVLIAALERLRSDALPDVAALLLERLRGGNKVLVAGNGGSAAEAQHFAAELVGRFKRERSPYAAICLNADTSVLTAIANDYGYEQVFARQVCGLGQRGDVLVTFSTSGESENLVRAAMAAREVGMAVVAVVRDHPCRLERRADFTIGVPADDTPTAQELHMIVTHLLCDVVEAELSGDGS